MKKLLFVFGVSLIVSACTNFNEKQPVDQTYYKNTQGIAWPEKQAVATNTASTKSKEVVKKVADKTAETATKVAEKATTVSKTITTTTTTYTK